MNTQSICMSQITSQQHILTQHKIQSQINKYESKQHMYTHSIQQPLQNIQLCEPSKKSQEIMQPQMNQNIKLNNPIKLRTQQYLFLYRYYDFFKDIIPDPQNYVPEMPSDQQFKKHKIKYLKGNKFYQQLQSYHQPYIRIKNIQRQGTIIIYTVIISMFELEITLLNIDQDAKIQMNKIGSGCFGSVRIQSQNKRMFAVKRQMFKEKYNMKQFNMMANKYEIEQVIKQLAIYKICSLLKIGPAAETDIGFDLICYRNCIEFQIQYCIKIAYESRNEENMIFVDQRKFQKQIKQCLLTLHFYRIIHKDIKPANILFSIKYNKYVLTDFGVSHPIVESIGYCSLTHCQGTLRYMSKQMLKILASKIGYVHLYGNDVYSLRILFYAQITHQNIENSLKQFNSMLIKKQYNIKYEYEYLRLKYYCIKPNSKMQEVQNYWKYMNTSRREQLIAIVDKSIQHDKIKCVYSYLSKSQEFKEYDLESLRIQSQSIKNVKIDPDITKITQFKLMNTLRVYGYSQQVKDMIIQSRLQQKYKQTLKMIDKIIDKKIQLNYRDILFGNRTNYIKKIKKQLAECQQKQDYKGMFNKYMIILQNSNIDEQIKTIQKLNILNYERKKEEKIEQMIIVYNIEKNKLKLKQFAQLMEIKDEERDQIIEKKNLFSNVASIYNYIGNYQKALQYYNKSLNMHISFQGQQHPSVTDTYNNIASVHESLGIYKKALQYYTKSINMQISFFGQQHPNISDTYNNIANVYDSMGNYQKALKYYTKSINMQISFFGQQHPNIADTYNNIAILYYTMGKYSKALQYYNKSVNMQISFYGQQHPNIANTYNNIADVFNSLGKYQKALQYYTNSVTMQISFHGQQHPSVADTYNNIAGVYFYMGKYDKSLQYYTKSVNMQILFYGQQHPNIAATYNNIAGVYRNMGRYQKALQYYTRSVTMQISFFGQQHPNNADIYDGIAGVYDSMGKYKIALAYYTKSINMHKSFHGQQHPSVADAYNNIAGVYRDMAKYYKALKYYTKSVNMQISFYGQQHPNIADTYNNIAILYYTMGKYSKALQYYNKSVNMQISFYGQQHLNIADTYNNIALLYYSMGKYETSLTEYNKSIQMNIQFHGKQHPNIATTYNNIACVYDSMGKYQKALQYYTKSVNMQISFYGQKHPFIADTYNNIAGINKDMRKHETAIQYYTKSVNMKIQFYGYQHPSIADTYNNIAGVYKDMTKYDKSLQYYTKSVNMQISFYGQQHPNLAATYNNIAGVYDRVRKYSKALQYYTKSVTMQILFYGHQHPFIADTYYNISCIYLSISYLAQSLKYCFKSIIIRSNLQMMRYPQMTSYYLQLSLIFIEKSKNLKSLNYSNSALDVFFQYNSFDHQQSPKCLSLLADIYYNMNKFIQSYFFYRLSCQILVRYFPIHYIKVRESKHMMNEMEWSMPSLIYNYASNIQFMNEIPRKYGQLPKHKLMKLLLAKKWQMRFEQQHRSRRDKFQYFKCMIQIYLCYKYLGYLRQMKKEGESIKKELQGFSDSQQQLMFKEFIQEIYQE